jgi:ribosomal protein S18 acetylase RimI-like enzyme
MAQLSEPTRLTRSKIPRASDVLGRAFQDDPLMKYLMPEDTRRARLLPRFLGTCVRYGYLYGEVYATAGPDGVAVWLTPANPTLTYGGMFRSGMLAASLRFGLAGVGRFMNLGRYTDELHRRSVPGPHWYLFLLGVEPARQGQGIGGLLIEPVLARSDADNVPCYLETPTERDVGFYQKHGFKIMVDGEVPNGGPRLWTMLREPRR